MKHKILTTAVLGGVALVASAFFAPVTAEAHPVKPEEIPSKIVANTIPQSLTGAAGNAEKGFATSIHRKKGNCLACHTLPAPKEQFHGNIGPDLAGVGSRMNAAELRLQIVDPKVNNPDTIMPGFYVKDLPGTAKKFAGKTMMSAEEIEDVIAYLLTLK